MTQPPSVGDVVHYVARGSADGVFPPVCRAATITEVIDLAIDARNGRGDTVATYLAGRAVGLAVMNPTGLFFHPASGLGVGGPIGYDPGQNEDDDLAGPLCGGWHRPGTWHWPIRTTPEGSV